MASQKQQYTILYGRLSQEDERAGESNSIQHQRDLLEKFARDKGFENTLFLADDGYSWSVHLPAGRYTRVWRTAERRLKTYCRPMERMRSY